MKDLTVIMPVYKEDSVVVTKTYCELSILGCQVIVVDDGNFMADLPDEVRTITYPAHMGYGYAIKQGIKAADTPIVCTVDGDGQHTASDVQSLYTVYKIDNAMKMVVGQRWNLKEAPFRWLFRKILNFIASLISGHYMADLNSGMRMFDKKMAEGYSPILCDTFSFTTSLTMSVVTDGHKMAYFPINVKKRAVGKSRVRLLQDGLVTLYYIIWVGSALRTRRIRAWLRSVIAGR